MVLTLLFLMTVGVQEDPQALVEKLRSDDITVREGATAKLKELGRAAQPALEKAAKDPDGEVSSRAKLLLRRLEVVEKLTPNLLKSLPDVADRLAGGNEHTWTEIFLGAAAVENSVRKHPELKKVDLEALTISAFRGTADPQEQVKLIGWARLWRLHAAIPELIPLIKSPNVSVSRLAGGLIAELGAGERSNQIAELLKDANPETRSNAAWALIRNAKKHLPEIRALIKDENKDVRGYVMRALTWIGDREIAETLVPLLESKEANDQVEAIRALGSLGGLKHAKMIAEFLDDKRDPLFRIVAVQSLGALGAREYEKKAAALLDDDGRRSAAGYAAQALARMGLQGYAGRIAALAAEPEKNPGMQMGELAVRALIDLGSPEHSKHVAIGLKSPNDYPRAVAIEGLAALGAVEHLGDVTKLLDDKSPWIRWVTARATGELAARSSQKDRDEVALKLKTLLKDPSDNVRFTVGAALVRLGKVDHVGQLELIRQFEETPIFPQELVVALTDALLEAHEPATFAKLIKWFDLPRAIETEADIEAALRPLGLRPEKTPDLGIIGRMCEGRRTTPLRMLRGMRGYATVVVADGERVQLLGIEDGLKHWKSKLGTK